MTAHQRQVLEIALRLQGALERAGITPAELRQLRALRELRRAVEARPSLRRRAG